MRVFQDIDAVLFDLDGTLIDSAPDLAAAVDQMRVERGFSSLPLEKYRPQVGSGARGMLSVAFGLEPGAALFESMREEFFANYANCMTQRTRTFDGVDDLIASLVALKVPWGVVTNKPGRFTDPLTRAMALFASAKAIVSGDTTPFAKPHPEPLWEAARRLGVPAARCIYVGDDERDVLAGRAAGMVTVAASYGYLGEQPDLAKWRADAEIKSPLDVLQLLGKA